MYQSRLEMILLEMNPRYYMQNKID